MHPDREIVCLYRRSDGLSMRPDGPNTLTCQSVGMNEYLQGSTSRPCYSRLLKQRQSAHGDHDVCRYDLTIYVDVNVEVYVDIDVDIYVDVDVYVDVDINIDIDIDLYIDVDVDVV